MLLERNLAHAANSRHPEMKDRTILEVFEAERASLVPLQGPFRGFHEVTAAVSKTCLVSFDRNRYSVAATAVGRPVQVQAYATKIVVLQDGRIVGEHARVFGRDQTIYDPWHYLPVLERKPGALRNGAPFKALVLPPALTRIRARLAGTSGGDRQMVSLLVAAHERGVEAVEAACAEALAAGLRSADAILNILSRQDSEAPADPVVEHRPFRLEHDAPHRSHVDQRRRTRFPLPVSDRASRRFHHFQRPRDPRAIKRRQPSGALRIQPRQRRMQRDTLCRQRRNALERRHQVVVDLGAESGGLLDGGVLGKDQKLGPRRRALRDPMGDLLLPLGERGRLPYRVLRGGDFEELRRGHQSVFIQNCISCVVSSAWSTSFQS